MLHSDWTILPEMKKKYVGNEMQCIQTLPVYKTQEIFGRKKAEAYSAANVVLTGISCPRDYRTCFVLILKIHLIRMAYPLNAAF
jgi:hypothetical protein